jgi:hypothetical protein
MINVQIKNKRLNGFEFFNILLPVLIHEDDKLILQFANNATYFGYESYLIKLLKEIRLSEDLQTSILLRNKVDFIVDLMADLMRYASNVEVEN